jgi:D-alanyl-D-alanine carboxypeptidase (penicillin-binding protein 5/6)
MMRDNNVADLLDTGFEVLTRRSRGELTTVAANLAEPEDLNDKTLERLVEQGDGDTLAAASAKPK